MARNPVIILNGIVLLTATSMAVDLGNKNPQLTEKVIKIFKENCTKCHEGDDAEAGLRVLDFKQIITGSGDSGKLLVDSKQPEKSLIYQQVISKDGIIKPEMPKGKNRKALNSEEAATLLDWIKTETVKEANASVVPSRNFITNKQIEKYISDYLDEQTVEDAKDLRFITLTHLYNREAPYVSDADLESHRQAISKAVNSLSWEAKIHRPIPIDPARTIFAIRNSDYGWTHKTWERMGKFYPYSIEFDTVRSRQLRDALQTEVPYVRGDWFVAKVTRPPLYHDVLELPENEVALETRLGINVLQDFLANNVARAGFRGKKFPNGSRVSDNNRLLQFHKTKYGSYAKSYDFKKSEEDHNLLENPLGPGDGFLAFKHDGGEIIFHLPNGFQAYMIVDGSGLRINSAPTDVVRDYTHNLEAVVNGFSCISCHSEGMNKNYDQVLDHALKSPTHFLGELDRMKKIYKNDQEMDALFESDNLIFRKAMDAAGVTVDKEPIARLAQEFDEPVSEAEASAELGLRLSDFENQLNSKNKLQDIRAFFNTGGVTRDQFIGLFHSLVEILDVGKAHSFENPNLENLSPKEKQERLDQLKKDSKIAEQFIKDQANKKHQEELAAAAVEKETLNAAKKKEKQKTEALLNAASNGDLQAVKGYLSEGYNVDGPYSDGSTPLMRAVGVSESDVVNLEIAALLLLKGANYNRRNEDGETALIIAARNGNVQAVNLLLHAPQISVDVLDRNQSTALMATVSGVAMSLIDDLAGAKIVTVLLFMHADPNRVYSSKTLFKGKTTLDLIESKDSGVNTYPLTRKALKHGGAKKRDDL